MSSSYCGVAISLSILVVGIQARTAPDVEVARASILPHKSVGSEYTVQDAIEQIRGRPALSTMEVSDLLAKAKPDQDYPALLTLPNNIEFSCAGKLVPGFYADPKYRCQVYHRCQGGSRRGSFFCSPRQVFNQASRSCDHFYNVNCSLSESFQYLQALTDLSEEKLRITALSSQKGLFSTIGNALGFLASNTKLCCRDGKNCATMLGFQLVCGGACKLAAVCK